VEDAGHALGNRGLAGSWIAGEGHVQRRRVRREVELPPRALDEQQRRDLADTLLDRLEPDQFPVELLEDFRDAGIAEIRREIDGGGGRTGRLVHDGRSLVFRPHTAARIE
jgi:hypothetical protein